MVVLYGVYRFFRKTVAFRNDYCFTCGGPVRSVQKRVVPWLHIFFIPILPLGIYRPWECTKCGQDPRERLAVARWIVYLGLAVVLLFAFVFWMVPGSGKDAGFVWGIRLGATAVAALIAWYLWRSRHRIDQSHAERLSQIPPAQDTACPLCGAELLPAPAASCPSCGVQRV